MSRRRPRGLRPDERDLWNRVARTAHAMRPGKAAPPPEEPMPPVAEPAPAPPRADLPEPFRPAPFRLGGGAASAPPAHALVPGPAERLAAEPLRMDPKAHKKLTRGRLEPEARIDLHGMTQAEAHPELARFILAAHGRGLRLVLVITGKGKRIEDDSPIPRRVGVLRHNVPMWLASGPLRLAVAQVTPAHQKHGGEGAYYVWLRRR